MIGVRKKNRSNAWGLNTLLAGIFFCSCFCLPVWAQTIAVSGKTIHTVSQAGTIQDGVILIQDGRIAQVGPAAEVMIPSEAERFVAEVITPGFIDAHSVVGLSGWHNVLADQDQDELTAPNQAELRAIDGFNPADPLLAYLLRHGVTVIQAGPGHGNPIGGQAGIFKTAGTTVEAMTIRFPSAMIFTLGESPKKVYGKRKHTPMTRMGTAAFIRQALTDARVYVTQWQEYKTQETDAVEKPEEKKKKAPDRDLKKEALAAVVQGQFPVLITAHREDDILTALRIAQEFNLTLILDAATEGYLVAPEILQAGIPVIVHPTMQRIRSPETANTSLENAALLADAGIAIALQSGVEAYMPKTRLVLFEAAIAMVNGLGFERALRSITIDAARLLNIDKIVGSLDIGKDADLVLFDGNPFEYTSHIQAVILNGRTVYQRPASP